MATLNGDNYKLQYVDKPSEKVGPGEIAGRKRLLFEVKTLDAVITNGDVILGPKIPAGARITDAKLYVSKSLGATGIFDLGRVSGNADGYVKACDAGGQLAFKAMDNLATSVFEKLSAEDNLQITCTETTDGSVLDGIISAEIEYVVD